MTEEHFFEEGGRDTKKGEGGKQKVFFFCKSFFFVKVFLSKKKIKNKKSIQKF